MVSVLYERRGQLSFDEDAALAQRAASGDDSAFRRLYERHYDRVFAIARGIVLDAEEARDLAQEVFTLIYKNLHKFDGRARFSTWLYRISVNRAVQESRRLKFRWRLQPLGPEAMAVAQPSRTDDVDPAVENALSKLSPPDRAIIVLFYWESMSLAEMGQTLGCSENAAKTRLFRARERFRAAYVEEKA